MSNIRKLATAPLVLFLATAAGFLLGKGWPSPADAAAPGGLPAAVTSAFDAAEPSQGGGAPPALGLPDFRDVAKRVIPSVVTVRSQRTVQVGERGGFGDPFGDDFLERFFGAPPGRQPREGGGQRFIQRGLGSGVIVSADGYVITNNHVVEGVDKVEVVLSDGRSRPAKILGADPQTDIAVLKVDGNGLRPVEMGDSERLEVGEWVLAVGNPFSETLGHTVTAGIVSAKGRSNLQLADYEDFIQTDAAINPGNSGGALVNTRGQLVGINTAIVSRSGGYQGVGFAIPIQMARSIMDQLVKKGRVVRGWMGLSIQDLTPDLAEGIGLEGHEGAMVAEVTPDSPAMEAGLRRGDVITAVDGQKVRSNAELRNRIAGTAPGTRISLSVVRDGRDRTIPVTLGELPGSGARASGEGDVPSGPALGLTVRPLTPDLAARLGFEDEQGVVVSEVEPASPAGEAGLQRGDLIKEVNRKAVTSVPEFRDAVAAVPKGKVVVFLVRRGDRVNYLTLKP